MFLCSYVAWSCLDLSSTSLGSVWAPYPGQVQVLFGPMVQLYPPGHPLDPERRDGLNGPEYARAITIGDDCWIGGGAIILGATIAPRLPCITVQQILWLGYVAAIQSMRSQGLGSYQQHHIADNIILAHPSETVAQPQSYPLSLELRILLHSWHQSRQGTFVIPMLLILCRRGERRGWLHYSGWRCRD